MMNDIEHVNEDMIAQDLAGLTSEARERIRKAAQLWRAQMLCLWKLCPKAACRKAQACSGDPDFCVGRFESLASDDVRTAVETLMNAKLFGSSYDDGCAMSPPGSIEAYHVWLANLFGQQAAPVSSQPREAQ